MFKRLLSLVMVLCFVMIPVQTMVFADDPIKVEGEATAGRTTNMPGVGPTSHANYSGGTALYFEANTPPVEGKYYVSYAVDVPKAGAYNVKIRGSVVSEYLSPYSVSVNGGAGSLVTFKGSDGTSLSVADNIYCEFTHYVPFMLYKGVNIVTFTMEGARSYDDTVYSFTLDSFELNYTDEVSIFMEAEDCTSHNISDGNQYAAWPEGTTYSGGSFFHVYSISGTSGEIEYVFNAPINGYYNLDAVINRFEKWFAAVVIDVNGTTVTQSSSNPVITGEGVGGNMNVHTYTNEFKLNAGSNVMKIRGDVIGTGDEGGAGGEIHLDWFKFTLAPYKQQITVEGEAPTSAPDGYGVIPDEPNPSLSGGKELYFESWGTPDGGTYNFTYDFVANVAGDYNFTAINSTLNQWHSAYRVEVNGVDMTNPIEGEGITESAVHTYENTVRLNEGLNTVEFILTAPSTDGDGNKWMCTVDAFVFDLITSIAFFEEVEITAIDTATEFVTAQGAYVSKETGEASFVIALYKGDMLVDVKVYKDDVTASVLTLFNPARDGFAIDNSGGDYTAKAFFLSDLADVRPLDSAGELLSE